MCIYKSNGSWLCFKWLYVPCYQTLNYIYITIPNSVLSEDFLDGFSQANVVDLFPTPSLECYGLLHLTKHGCNITPPPSSGPSTLSVL